MSGEAAFAEYRDALRSVAELAHASVSDLVSQVGGLPTRQAAALLLTRYPELASEAGMVAAACAAEYYQRVRDEAIEGRDGEDVVEYTATPADPVQASWAVEDVAKAANEGLGTLPGRAVERAYGRADLTITSNARRDPARPRWAVVPSPGACGFCVMVASNGWAYSEAGARARRHANCRCTAAVSFDEPPHLDGYDPDAMRDAYAMAEEAVHDDVEREWAAMSTEERKAYGRNGRSARDVYKTRRVAAEMDRRNRDWLQTGEPRFRSKEPGAHPLKKERDVGTCLLMQGFDVRFIKEINKTHVRTADAYLNDEVWEFKVPEGWSGEHTIRTQFYRARDKGTDKLLISATKNGASLREMERHVLTTFEKGDYTFINEVLLMSADGEHLMRLHR